MSYLQDLQPKLSQHIPYQWRVQSRTKDRSKAICTAYIDARDVMNVLDKYCEYGWESEFKEVNGFIFCGITIHTADSFLTRWDAGMRVENNPDDQMYDQAGKSAASDAFKRAAVMWGVGRFLYDLPMVTLPCDQYGNVVDGNGNRVWDLTDHINNLKKVTIPPEQPVFDGKETLSHQKFDAMVKFITEGKIKEVEQALKKYDLNESQQKVLGAMLNKAKSESLTKSAKK